MKFAGRRVLVVEDVFLVSLPAIDLLEGIGCVAVGPIGNIAAATQLAQSESLDAALLDINVAGEAIWPVAEKLRRRGVPFLFLSSHPQLNEIPAPFAATPCLAKPLEQNRLLRYLSAIWGVPADGAIPMPQLAR